MQVQKYKIGDLVRIRPFDEIDLDDIGTHRYIRNEYDPDKSECYLIPAAYINNRSREAMFRIKEVTYYAARKCYNYRLIREDGYLEDFYWAQGMLRPYYEEEPIVIPDKDPFDGLFGGVL